jgi:tetratricopeptide (TPR) repeat protein
MYQNYSLFVAQSFRDRFLNTFLIDAMPSSFLNCSFFKSSLKGRSPLRSVWVSTLFALACALSCALSANAQEFVRPEVTNSFKAAQDALNAGQAENAITLAQQTLSLPGITSVEKPVIQRTLAIAALQAKNFPLAIQTLEAMIQEMPEDTLAVQKLPLMEALLSASEQVKDLPRVVNWARIYLKLEGGNPSVRPVLIQTLFSLNRHEEVIQEVKEKIRLDEAGKVKTPESDLRTLAVSQRQVKDDAGYNSTLKMLLQNYPTKAYWAESIARLGRQANFNARFDLDLYRILEITGNMQDAVDYVDMANLALKAGLPAEAARVVELAFAAGKMGKGSDVANHQKLRQQIQQQLAEDDKAFPALERSAKDANTLASLAEVYAAKQNWSQAQALFSKALAMGGLRREAETRLHAGIVLHKLGQKVEATKMWDSIQGEATAVQFAQLWKTWQGQN